ncbi:MAG: hypothetical protein JXB46_05630 [Candidatus Eisenbacteria bacterium]|nr:hypothetical protein [Candidatus Eisenbacteria bacterium]
MWGWIPQAYYDLMARIVPGAILIFSSVFLRHGPGRGWRYVVGILCEGDQTSPCRVAVALLTAYLLGLVLSELGELVAGRVLRGMDWGAEQTVKAACLVEHNHSRQLLGDTPLEMTVDELPSVSLMNDQLRFVAPDEVSRILKLRAERRLCRVLVFGFAILAGANLLLFSGDLMFERLWIEGALLALALILWRQSMRLSQRSERGTCRAWLMSVSLGLLRGRQI